MGVSYGGGGYAAPPSRFPSPPRKINWDWISESWRLFSQAAGVWVVGIILYGAASMIISAVLQGVFSGHSTTGVAKPPGVPDIFWRMFFGQLTAFGQIINYAMSVALGGFQSACFYRIAVKQVRGKSPEFNDLFNPGSIFVNMVVFNLIYALASILGFVACCIGIFAAMALFLPAPALVADGEGPWRATMRSFEAMKGDWANASGFMFIFCLLLIASIVPCGLGLFVTIPMQNLISALAYRDMIGLPANPQDGVVVDYGAPQAGVWPPPPDVNGGSAMPPSNIPPPA